MKTSAWCLGIKFKMYFPFAKNRRGVQYWMLRARLNISLHFIFSSRHFVKTSSLLQSPIPVHVYKHEILKASFKLPSV